MSDGQGDFTITARVISPTVWGAVFPDFSASVVLDSVSPAGARLTSMEWRYPRFIHSEVMTYRMLSRNTASSRAIPLKRTLESVRNNPAGPVWWGRAQPGMQAREELDGWRLWLFRRLWYASRYPQLGVVKLMELLGAHKQVPNRLLEPWLWHVALVTGSPVAFENVWRQRCHPDAQPEFRYLANLARACYNSSVPTERTVHLPYVEGYVHGLTTDNRMKVSTARCARLSYITQTGTHSVEADLKLYKRLHLEDDGEVPHTSPAEHPALATEDPNYRSGNFLGWRQFRELVDPHFVYQS